MGDLTSIISVVFQPKLDVLGIVIYGVELVLWIGVFFSGGYLGFIPWLQHKLEQRRTVAQSLERHQTRHGAVAVSLQDMPSSTSVFRTPEHEHELRSRAHAMTAVSISTVHQESA